MPTLNIQGLPPIQVGEEFLRLSPQQQAATVDEIVASVKGGPEGSWNNPDTNTVGGQAEDAAHGALTGLGKGALDIAGMPGTLADAASQGADWLFRKGAKLVTGTEPKTLKQQEADIGMPEWARSNPLSTAKLTQAAEAVTGPLYQPETKAGQIAQNVAEFVPGAAAMPGGGLVAKVAKFGLAPGAAAEAAGEATHGTKYEPYARAGAAIATGGLAGIASRPSTVGRVLRNSAQGVTEQQLQAAHALMNDALRAGSPISLDEAMQQVTGGATRLGDVRRIVEQSERGGPIIKEFTADRAANNQRLMDDTLAGIGPQAAEPSRIPAQMQEAAQGALDQTRQGINRLARPHYDAARGQSIPPAEFAQISGNPTFQEALRRVQADPIKFGELQHLPVNSVEVVDAVKKEMDTLIDNASNPLNPNRDNHLADLAGAGRRATVDEASAASPDYAEALRVGREGRQRVLQPMKEGPIGQVAATDSKVAQQNILMSQNPDAGSANEIQMAFRRLSRQNPQASRDLVRTRLESMFNETSQDLTGGPNQWGGARFRAAAAGNRQQRQNLEAIVTEVAGPDAADGLNRALDIFEAQGWRQHTGSQTAQNLMLQEELKRGGIVGGVVAQAASPSTLLSRAQKLYENFRFGRSTEELAHILTDPNAVQRLRNIALLPNNSPRARAIATVLALEAMNSMSHPPMRAAN